MKLVRTMLLSAAVTAATSIGLRLMLRVASVDAVADTLGGIVGGIFVLSTFRGSSGGKPNLWQIAGIAVVVNLAILAVVQAL